jgi:hypothetical protein
MWVGVGPAAADQANFTTPGTQNFTVPSGVTQLGISMCGAQGGKGGNGETVPPAEVEAQAVTSAARAAKAPAPKAISRSPRARACASR